MTAATSQQGALQGFSFRSLLLKQSKSLKSFHFKSTPSFFPASGLVPSGKAKGLILLSWLRLTCFPQAS